MSVVLIMIDGLRPDAIDPTRCPNISALCARGAATMRAASVMPSITLPCHTSIFHSVPPTRHGITTNLWQPMARPLPGLFDLASTAGKRCACFYNWEPLRDLGRPGSLALAYFQNTAEQLDGDRIVAEQAAQVLRHDSYDFAFVYFGTVDTSGHRAGWMSEDYLVLVAHVDSLLGPLLAALPLESIVLIQSDHGGHDRSHGTACAEDMTIPWMVAGPGIRRGHIIATPVSLLDTAPTLARVLGLVPDPAWEGRCVEEIFAPA